MSRSLKTGRVFKRFALDRGRKVVLRGADARDLDKLLAFINGLANEKRRDKRSQLFTGFDSKVTRKREAEWLQGLLANIRQGETVSVLAEVEGEIVGNGEITRGPYKETKHLGHLGLTIRGAYRGLGIGREMVRTLLLQARRQGLKMVHVEFLSTNRSAVRVYKKAGFTKVGAIPGKVRRNGKFIDSIIMARAL